MSPDDANEQAGFSNLKFDLSAGLVTALVALPLCLGIAFASDAPIISGLLSGIIGGIIVGSLSGSHTSVAGPAAALIALVAVQIKQFGSFEAFLLVVLIAGLVQIILGVLRAGELSAFFPSSVVKGLLAAIGVILILKQTPYLAGHSKQPPGDLAFEQISQQNSFTDLIEILSGNFHGGALTIGLICVLILIAWDRVTILRRSIVPGALVATVCGVLLMLAFKSLGDSWAISAQHLVSIPIPESSSDWSFYFRLPDFTHLKNPSIYVSGVSLAIIASLLTLLNLEAIDKLDPMKRRSPPSRELIAHGVGNTIAGLVGAIPMTSVVVRGSVNVSAGAKSKVSTIIHGVLILVSVVFFARYLNLIPLSALAAILIVTGLKLASPQLFSQMWKQGKYQLLPFLVTLLAIVFTDVLSGILLGLTFGLLFVLYSNIRRPIRLVSEKHLDGDVLHLYLANQVSFLKRAAIDKVLNEAKPNSHFLIDASQTDYIDPDVLTLIREFRDSIAPHRGVTVSLRGFHEDYELTNEIQFVDYSTRELLDRISPRQVLEIMTQGNKRFRNGRPLDAGLSTANRRNS